MIATGGTDALEILLVEDNQGDAMLARLSLEAEWRGDFTLEEAGTLEDAQHHVRDAAVACVLLDLSLPDASGLSGLAAIQASAPEAAIVVLSGLADEEVALEAVQRGAQDYIVKGRLDDEGFARAVRYAIERKRGEIALAHQALHDPLTDLPNRALFSDRLAQAHSRGRGCAVLAVDLDRFKEVDDELGRERADDALCEVGRRVAEVIAPADTVARFGGDEFMVLCEGIGAEAGAVSAAERIAAAVSEPLAVGGRHLVLSTSIGIAFSEEGEELGEDLVREADQALYRAKAQGGNRYELSDGAQQLRAVKRRAAETRLAEALAGGELEIHYQPIFDLSRGEAVGAEALLRWEHPECGLIGPDQFIPLAEETGLIIPIGAWVIGQACRQVRLWPADFTVSINLAERQLADGGLLATVEAALEESGADPASICLEVTETVAVEDSERNRSAISGLRETGIKLALDDFGTGYASLSFLKRFPLDVLKIDRSFVAGISPDSEDAAIVGAIVALASARELIAVAEGVETVTERDTLKAMGCDRGQGFLFSRPMPVEQLTELLAVRS